MNFYFENAFAKNKFFGAKFVITLLLLTVVLGIQSYLVQKTPNANQSNVIGITNILTSESFSPPPTTISPQEFCEKWTGQPSTRVDCRSTLSIESLLPLKADDADKTVIEVNSQAIELLKWLKNLRLEIESQSRKQPIQASLISPINAKIDSTENYLNSQVNNENLLGYKLTFQWLLQVNGVSYDGAKDQFSLKRWDISRLFDKTERLKIRGQEQASVLQALPYLILISSVILLILAYWRDKWTGFFIVSIYLCLTTFGLVIAADAAMLFGQNSLYYALNPLGNQLNRQIEIQICGHLLLGSILFLKPWLQKITSTILHFHFATVWIVSLLVVVAYGLQSPALGSETLKLGLAIVAASLMTDQGRILHLVNKYAPATIKINLRALKSNFDKKNASTSASQQVLKHISKPLINITAFGLIALSVVAIGFKDLGGALIASLVLITTLFLVFGSKPAIFSLSAMGLTGAVLSQTEKVQGRIQLMVEPMNAAVSDFARLVSFTEASKPNGYGLGQIEWCNDDGACLPLQVLSDYIPTLLNGVWGPELTKAFFILLCMYFSIIAILACWRYLTGIGGNRMVAMTSFFLILASLFQTVITFFGNWRLIPLTGLGTPLLSIGISAMLAPTLAIGLLLVSTESNKGRL